MRAIALAVAAAPDRASQATLARFLVQITGGAPADPVYADWIGMFSGDGYDDLVRASTALLDSCAAAADQAAAEAAFDGATGYELAFWEMAYTRGASDGHG